MKTESLQIEIRECVTAKLETWWALKIPGEPQETCWDEPGARRKAAAWITKNRAPIDTTINVIRK